MENPQQQQHHAPSPQHTEDDDVSPTPQRLSALYQYHNAPEVAPAHGLEYDDTIYPSSDKYPVTREHASYGKTRQYGYDASDNRPPRIIFGMKVRTFLVVATVMIMVIVGAAVGGAVGGQQLRDSQSQDGMGIMNITANATTSATPTATPSSYSAPTPTYTPLSDCPASNNTLYTSTFAKGSSGNVPANAGLNFTRWCGLSDPLSRTGSERISEAYVYSFADCIEACAGYNFWNDGRNCTAAVYQPGGGRPGNCWFGNAGNVSIESLNAASGTNVALLD